MAATSNVIDQEKMAIILQEVVGTQYNDRYYPSFAGVGRSINYYPINDEKAEDGVVDLAIGLGNILSMEDAVYDSLHGIPIKYCKPVHSIWR